MAITNAQQAKQLLALGGRIGLRGGGADMGAKKKKYNRGPQSRNKMQPSRSMSIDTTTGISKMKDGGICRGAGAAIKGTKFQGVF